MTAWPQRLRRALRRAPWRRDPTGTRAGTHAGEAHVRVLDVTDVSRREARRLARRLAAGRVAGEPTAPELIVLAGARTAPLYARAGLTVETVASDEERDRSLSRYGRGRTARVVPLGRTGPIAVAPVQVVAAVAPATREVVRGPYFVGGTGRSGTWALGRLLAAHPDLVTIHTEVRFHAQRRAFSRLLDGSLPPSRYADEFLERYFGLTSGDGTAKGIQLLASRWEVKSALRRFRRDAESDLPAAMGGLVHRLVDPYARARGASGWVETTPGNAAVADGLTAALPAAHVVHVVRDGRDVAASIAGMPWGPSDILGALDVWADGLRKADAAFRRADPARTHVVRFEDLVIRDRDRTLTDLLDRLGLEERDDLHASFATKLDPARSNVGRWRRDAGAAAEAAIDARYRAVLDQLRSEGIACLPVPPDELATTPAVR